MSGGSLDYVFSKVEDAAIEIKKRSDSTLYRAFANHLLKVARALHAIEWVLSGDISPGDDVKAIEAVISKEDRLAQVKEDAEKILEELRILLNIEKQSTPVCMQDEKSEYKQDIKQ